jgi:hypothetical protein
MAVTGYEFTYCNQCWSIDAGKFSVAETYVQLSIRSIKAHSRRTSRTRSELTTTAADFRGWCIRRRSTRLVLCRRGQDGCKTGSGQGLDESPDVLLGPAIVVRNDDVEGVREKR